MEHLDQGSDLDGPKTGLQDQGKDLVGPRVLMVKARMEMTGEHGEAFYRRQGRCLTSLIRGL